MGSQYHLEVGGQDYYLDLLFYHLRLRCFVVIDLKIEEFKPEFASKMNFYLSAVDDQLRHATDATTIGIILCKHSNEVIVEYALRDAAKPMGVAKHVLGEALPIPLQSELPTAADFARKMPSFTLVQLRIEIERALRSLLSARGIESKRPPALGTMLRKVGQHYDRIFTSEDVMRAIAPMNAATHGFEISGEEAQEASGLDHCC